MAYSFSLQVAEFAKKAKGDTQEIVKKVAIDVASKVVLRSPVGNPEIWAANAGKKPGDKGYVGKGYVGGRFRANWIVTLDQPSTDTIDDVDPSGSTAISAAIAAVSDATLGQTIYIANNLPYARRLEDGWSKQSPQGMVALTAIEFQQFVDKAVRSMT